MKKVDGPAVRLVDETDAALAAMPGELAVTLSLASCKGPGFRQVHGTTDGVLTSAA